jgi:HNH endonuclease
VSRDPVAIRNAARGRWGDRTLEERFAAKVRINEATGCWLWQASKDPRGYGQINVDGRPTKAQRVAWELFVGPIPEGLHIDHLCRVPSCVNPAHLEPVTAAENTRRQLAAIGHPNSRKTHCPRGHPYNARRGCTPCHTEASRRHRARQRAHG